MGGDIRILVAFEEEYRAFRDTIAGAFELLRPADEVEVAGLEALVESLVTFEPHLVVASLPSSVHPNGGSAWVMLSPDPEVPSRVLVGGRSSEELNPSMGYLLSVANETEGLAAEERPNGTC